MIKRVIQIERNSKCTDPVMQQLIGDMAKLSGVVKEAGAAPQVEEDIDELLKKMDLCAKGVREGKPNGEEEEEL